LIPGLKTIAALLCFVGISLSAPPTLTIPPEVKPVNGYAIVAPATDCKTVTYIGMSGIYPLPSMLLADKRMFVLPTQGLSQGMYKFTAVGSLNDDHAVVEFVVNVGTGPLPDPKPVDPTPVDPVDPEATALSNKLKAAFKDSGFTKAAELADGCDDCRIIAAKAKNTGEFISAGQDALKTAMNGEQLPDAVKKILADETTKVLPTDPSKDWGDSGRKAARNFYVKLARAVRIAGGVK